MGGRIESIEPAASAAGSKALATTLAGAGTLSFGGITANEAAMYGGLVIAGMGLVLQWYYQRRRDLREQLEHEIKLQALRGGYE